MAQGYRLRRSARAKFARITVSAEKVEVVAPAKMPQIQIDRFVASKQAWIDAAMTRLRLKKAAVKSFAPDVYLQGELIPYQGARYPLVLEDSTLKGLKVAFDNGFRVTVPLALSPIHHQEAIKHALTEWMKKAIKPKIHQYIHQHAPRRQLMPTMVRVKTQKSRWGSCSSKNAININWLLVLAPPAILEYVVVHELCHIKEKNHSAAFWQLVAEHLPDYQQHRLWLKQHGASLMLGL